MSTTEIKSDVQELADKLKAGLSHTENGVLQAEADLFQNTLTNGLTEDEAKRFFKHINSLVPAFSLAVGEKAEELAKKDKKIEDVTGEMKMLNAGKLAAAWTRSMERRKSVSDPTMVTVYGNVTPKLTISATKSAELKRVRTALQGRAEKLFK